MAKDFKQGYTWYPKDWVSSEELFELTWDQRGVYRELIDRAYMSDNRIPKKVDVWSRQWVLDPITIGNCIFDLNIKGLIIDKGEYIEIPSVQKRLDVYSQKSKAGRKGGNVSAQARAQPNINIKEKVKVNDVPTFEEFKSYALTKSNDISQEHLKYKYESWVENGWKDGNNNKIKNWKSKLLNTIPHLPKVKKSFV